MYNELEHHYDQEAVMKPKFKNVTFEDVLESIDRIESEAKTMIDVQYTSNMRIKLERIKN